ncbi:hypothetical protein D9M70_358370 [compost metagenome]
MQQRRDAQAVQGAGDIGFAARRQQHGGVAQRLDILAAVADNKHRAEHGIPVRADHAFALAAHHARDDDAFAMRVHGLQRAHLGAECARYCLRIMAVQGDQPVLALVRHLGRARLDRHRRADALPRGHRGVHVVAKIVFHHRHASRGETCQAGGFAQRRAFRR